MTGNFTGNSFTAFSRRLFCPRAARRGALLARLTQVRAQAGDAHAFDDYAAWLLTTSPADRDFPLAESLLPCRQYPANQVLLATA